MVYMLLACQVLLATTLLLAAVSKLLYPQNFIAAIRASSFPKSLIYPCAMLTIFSESELALGLVFSTPWSLPIAFVGSAFLLGIFTFWQISVRRRHLSVQCGCFGPHNSPVTRKSIARNLLFIGIALLGLFSTRFSTSILPSLSSWTFVAGIVLAGSAIFLFVRRQSATVQNASSLITAS